MNKRIVKKIWYGVAFIAVCAAVIAVVMLLWNALIPSIIGWSAINYWQAAGLMILSKFLFGGFGHHGHRFCGRRRGHRKHGHLHDKLSDMSHDERREFIRKKMSMGFRNFDDICEHNDKRNESSERNEE